MRFLGLEYRAQINPQRLKPALLGAETNAASQTCRDAALTLICIAICDLLGLAGGTQQELRAAIQVNVFRCGNDHGSLRRAGRRGIDRKAFQAEYAAAVGSQPARRGQPAHGA